MKTLTEQLRMFQITSYGGKQWNSYDMISFLNQNSINNYTINLNQIDSLQRQINLGNIAILNVLMGGIRNEENDKWHIDKFNNLNGDHYIIVKGYKIVDNLVYYEVY